MTGDVTLRERLEQVVAGEDARASLVGLVALVRPASPGGRADDAIGALADVLGEAPALADRVRICVRRALGETRLVHALAESGITSDQGLLPALIGRLAERVLPLPARAEDVRRLIREVFCAQGDARWVSAVEPACWARLLSRFVLAADVEGIPHPDVAAAAQGLAQRIAALGIDEELNARLPAVEDYDSPFLVLPQRTRAFIEEHAVGRGGDTVIGLQRAIDVCRALIEDLRARKGEFGTSLRLTAVTRRLLQQLRRLELMMHVIRPDDPDDYVNALAPLFIEVVRAELGARSVRRLLRHHADLLARQVTEQTAKKGVKYVTETAAGYWAFLRAALRGGAIVAVFALFKIGGGTLPLSLAAQGVLYSLNYALCFVLLYLTGSILATKQPAVTASALARCMDESGSAEGAVDRVADQVVLVCRSQFISFVGNLVAAFPVAMALGAGLAAQGAPVVDEAGAAALLAEVHPLRSGALLFAAAAGVFLFASGVIAGWVDNVARYVDLGRRLEALRALRGARGQRVAGYLASNAGMLSGNVALGFFLGLTGVVGTVLGLPLDIRHIAFSSANVGLAAITQAAPGAALGWAVVGVVGIGLVNFVVSFGLTLWTALRSRGVTYGQWRRLLGAFGARLRTRPMDWVVPPGRARG